MTRQTPVLTGKVLLAGEIKEDKEKESDEDKKDEGSIAKERTRDADALPNERKRSMIRKRARPHLAKAGKMVLQRFLCVNNQLKESSDKDGRSGSRRLQPTENLEAIVRQKRHSFPCSHQLLEVGDGREPDRPFLSFGAAIFFTVDFATTKEKDEEEEKRRLEERGRFDGSGQGVGGGTRGRCRPARKLMIAAIRER
ncbi:hypothetical protein LSTR_LSTR006336 [Laodelphax striatellus]|uniref:Uncharacterized protein n=1 Tax=Laodelphax striatellus TaxID=195883 RepID=A0A482XCU2_LAOST|nr:hypothetical protein LSTR_LSTR006336 [Laodelphax striatellus]